MSDSTIPSSVLPPKEPASGPSEPKPTASSSSTSNAAQDGETKKKQPICIVVIGMAGSGKTTLMQRLNSYLHSKNTPPYILNLDPAVTHMPYEANIDIRDTVDYREVMKQYNLGPNGGILTALNLFTTKFDQVLGFVEKRSESVDHILLDTPGQIEIFTWSASGSIITESIASSMPTCVAYVIDTPRTTSPSTFMSNMLYACSILYKTRLPFILVFNKTDVQPHQFAVDWMNDWQLFQKSLQASTEGGDGEANYMNSLMNSMCLVLDEFYEGLRTVGVSAMTGQGIGEFFDKVEQAREEYDRDYRPELEKQAKEKAAKKEADKQSQLERLMKDMSTSESTRTSASMPGGRTGDDRPGSGVGPGKNPFGPHGMNEREDRWYDQEDGEGDDDEDEDDMENDDELGPDADREQPYPGQRRFGDQGFEDSNWARPT